MNGSIYDESLRKELIRKGYERANVMTLENYAKKWGKIIDEKIYFSGNTKLWLKAKF